MLGGDDDSAMNLVSSLADFVYEIAFCLVIKHVKASLQTMRFIVTAGWSIYPPGHSLVATCWEVSMTAP